MEVSESAELNNPPPQKKKIPMGDSALEDDWTKPHGKLTFASDRQRLQISSNSLHCQTNPNSWDTCLLSIHHMQDWLYRLWSKWNLQAVKQNSFTDSLIGTFWLKLILRSTTTGNKNWQQLIMYINKHSNISTIIYRKRPRTISCKKVVMCEKKIIPIYIKFVSNDMFWLPDKTKYQSKELVSSQTQYNKFNWSQ